MYAHWLQKPDAGAVLHLIRWDCSAVKKVRENLVRQEGRKQLQLAYN